ncbi:MAG: mechanosensitive ion channel family protein, partial [Bacteroidetes bacterium]|nr:mechanosensitive ion channel family protein [Bacteroidota bacterium]
MIDLTTLTEPKFITSFKAWLSETFELTAFQTVYAKTIIFILAVAALSIIANYLTKGIILAIIKSIVKKSRTTWDDILLEKKVFNNLSHIAPAIVIYYLADYALLEFPGWIQVIRSGTWIYMTIIGMMVMLSFLKAVNAIYQTLPSSKNRSIKGYMQMLNVFIIIVGGIVIISVILDRNPTKIIAGLGVFVTALMFVFKDSLMGLAGGIQLSANDMVRPGDWISMPGRGADGTVLEITLNTVKVQNWDKTITTLPTYSLISESFKNWRGMEESGGRRICRNINLDLKSIRFCDEAMLKKFEKIRYLNTYITRKREELLKWNTENNIDDPILVNGRRMTNIG